MSALNGSSKIRPVSGVDELTDVGCLTDKDVGHALAGSQQGTNLGFVVGERHDLQIDVRSRPLLEILDNPLIIELPGKSDNGKLHTFKGLRGLHLFLPPAGERGRNNKRYQERQSE